MYWLGFLRADVVKLDRKNGQYLSLIPCTVVKKKQLTISHLKGFIHVPGLPFLGGSQREQAKFVDI